MELLQAIHGRRSVREFTDEPVSDAALQALIDAAVQAPSAINQQPWCFVVVREQSLLRPHLGPGQGASAEGFARRAGASFPRHAERSAIPHLLSCAGSRGDRGLPADRLGGRGLRARRREHDACRLWRRGSAPAGSASPQHWLGTPEGKEALGLPPSHIPIAPIIVGHPRRKPASVPRKKPHIRWLDSAGA